MMMHVIMLMPMMKVMKVKGLVKVLLEVKVLEEVFVVEAEEVLLFSLSSAPTQTTNPRTRPAARVWASGVKGLGFQSPPPSPHAPPSISRPNTATRRPSCVCVRETECDSECVCKR